LPVTLQSELLSLVPHNSGGRLSITRPAKSGVKRDGLWKRNPHGSTTRETQQLSSLSARTGHNAHPCTPDAWLGRARDPCQSPAMKNGRCRMHGGPSLGAPKGNRNALKHGRYTAEAVARRRYIPELVRLARSLVWPRPADEIDLTNVRFAQLCGLKSDICGRPRSAHLGAICSSSTTARV